jgi:ATP-dependent RNA helicase DeaD
MISDFSALGLHPALLQAIAGLGYTQPTPIQAAVIPLLLNGQDVIGQAQTGTGKTAAFALPILHNLVAGLLAPQAIVLVPTRELAQQVALAFGDYGRHQAVQVLPVYGGQAYGRQIGRLKHGVEVVVGTPGRVLDLLGQKALDLSLVQAVILDEADEMLSMGFIEDIEAILKETPVRRQTALFSATLPSAIRRLAERYMHQPTPITIQGAQRTVAAIEQRYYLVNDSDKLAALTRLLEFEPLTSALVFARTRVRSNDLAAELTAHGFPAEVLNGDLTQEERERVMGRFRQSRTKVLVATDVAARGLDVDDISHVFNYDLPDDEEIYVHRIGRTGRAGKAGIAISLVSPREQFRLRRIESFARCTLTRSTLPSAEQILSQREEQLLSQMKVWLERARYRQERVLVARLIEDGHDPLEIAAAAIKLARAEEKQRPILPLGELQSTTQPGRGLTSRRGLERSTHEPGMVRLTLSQGRRHGVRPNDVVSTLAAHANIPGSMIGKILIANQHTLVDVPEQFLDQVLAKAAQYRIHKKPVGVAVA